MRPNAVWASIGSLALVLACSLAATPPPKSSTASIEGTIRDAAGRPVVGALVAAVTENDGIDEAATRPAALTHSGKSGRFRLENLSPGNYSVTATHHDHVASLVLGKTLAAGQALRGLDLRLGATGITLHGVVTDARSHPIAGAQIRAMRYSNDLGDIFITETDATGAYEIKLPQARYYVAAAATGYDFDGVNSDTTGATPVNLALEKATPPGPPPPAVVDWIRSNAVPIRTVEAGHGFDDLEPLRATIGSARVVALGEATHGTREFFQLKHRMLEFLVARMGFNVFAIEATMPEGFDVNEYVLTGRGDPEKALSGLYFWTWDTEEVLEMIRWMRRWNSDPSHKTKVKFYGFDMQSGPRAAKNVLEALGRIDRDERLRSEVYLAPLANAYVSRGGARKETQELAAATDSTIVILAARFDSPSARDRERLGDRGVLLARQNLRVLQQWRANRTAGFAANIRDASMAENIRWILEKGEPGSKVVVWAHNGHVTALSRDDGGGGMGFDLRRALGSDLVVCGFSFDRGGFQAIDGAVGMSLGLHSFQVGPAREGSLDDALSRAGVPIAAIDLRRLPKENPVSEWFWSRHPTRSIGAGFSNDFAEQYYTNFAVPRAYDVILFVDSTSTARATRRGRVPAPVVVTQPTNLDFEAGALGSAPTGWLPPTRLSADHYRAEVRRDESRSGSRCAVLRRLGSEAYGETFGTLGQTLDATPYRGKRVRLSAMVRVDAGNEAGSAYLQLRTAAAPGKKTFMDGMEDRPITDRQWRRYTVEGEIPTESSWLTLLLAFNGDGNAWFDDVTLETIDPVAP